MIFVERKKTADPFADLSEDFWILDVSPFRNEPFFADAPKLFAHRKTGLFDPAVFRYNENMTRNFFIPTGERHNDD